MKILSHILLLLFISNTLFAQQMSVKSFRKLPTDLDAKENSPRKDQNGEVAALIKIITNETDFGFDGGMMGVVGSEQKSGEVWVWLPNKINRLTIFHSQLGVLRDYSFPERIAAATTYEMVLISGRVPVQRYGTLEISSNIAAAHVYLNDKYAGTVPNIISKIPIGTYDIEVRNEGYSTYNGTIIINGGKITTHLASLTMKSKYVSVMVTSSHRIHIFDRNIGSKVPNEGVALNYTNDDKHPDNNNSLFQGDFFSWTEAKTICPTGWRLPDKYEFEAIERDLQFSDKTAYLENADGIKCYFPFSGYSYGMSNDNGYYWSSTAHDDRYAYRLRLRTSSSSIEHRNSINKSNCLSVRCVRTVM